ncbi:MAG: S8 family peptidase, partial [Acidiferrobacteraceae bacterium]
MANGRFPPLCFPAPTEAIRNGLTGGGGTVHFPNIGRQRVRIGPQLMVLQQAFEARRLRLQQVAPTDNPELVLVLEVAGTVADFANAVSKVFGLAWLLEWAEEQIEPNEDFYAAKGEDQPRKPYDGRIFLLGTNQAALTQLLALWNRYQQNPDEKFARGLAPFKRVFAQLRNIRHWSVADRIDGDVRRYWQDRIEDGAVVIRFEIEAWCFGSQQKNEAARTEIEGLVRRLDGHVLSHALISDIAYHGLLVELPTAAIVEIVSGHTPELVLSDRIMFFRPQAQSLTSDQTEAQGTIQAEIPGTSDGAPVVALLDGLPLSNHPLLADRLVVDDPDGWAGTYEATDRVHGTAMASLILYGELDGAPTASPRKVYVRPIMRPDPTDTFGPRRREQTPDNELLIDLVHRAVKRICEGDAGQGPEAPSVRVINLSIGDNARVFVREMSPWARLLDWLAYRYSVLFIVSAGNSLRPLTLNIPPRVLLELTPDERVALAFTAMTGVGTEHRIIAPAEAINVLTVGALHADCAQPLHVPDRFDLFTNGGLSPLSRVGHGYRRSVKPDILMPGGRILYLERMLGDQTLSVLDAISGSAAPGHRVAVPPLRGEPLNATAHSRGTSNAAALASRAAMQLYDVIESLRAQT